MKITITKSIAQDGKAAPGIPDTAEGEFVEAELVWQWQCQYGIRKGEWTTFIDDELHDSDSKVPTRQIYRLSTPPDKEVERSGLKTAEDIKAKALMYVVDKFGDDFVKEDPDGAAVIIEVFIDGYNSNNPLT